MCANSGRIYGGNVQEMHSEKKETVMISCSEMRTVAPSARHVEAAIHRCPVMDTNAEWTSWCRGKAVEGRRESGEKIAAVTTSSSSAISGLYWWWLSCTWVEGLVEYRKCVAWAYERDWKR
jgi:hypothetical protein